MSMEADDVPNPAIEEFTDEPRRQEIELKHQRLNELLTEWEVDAVLILDPVNIAWLTSGLMIRGWMAAEETPALFFTAQARWLICSQLDSRRFFDEEIDELGFQLKEWAWYSHRDTLLNDLAAQKKIVCDRPFGRVPLVGEKLKAERRQIAEYEQFRLIKLGRWVGHALEASARNFSRGQTEEELAGQLGHRLLHHGIEPLSIQIAADGRAATYRRFGFTPTPIQESAVIQVTGRREGLSVTASRCVAFAPVSEAFQRDFEMATRLSAVYQAGTLDGVSVPSLLESGRRLLQQFDREEEWYLSPAGYRAGREPADIMLRSEGDDRLHAAQVVTWQAHVGAVVVCDSYLLTESTPRWLSTIDNWPIRRVRFQGNAYDRPDVLIRDPNE